ncbi:MAG TPA: transposase, partial [Chloroflexota bacterium]|nr:transposase [Chloroflexota bacterium]
MPQSIAFHLPASRLDARFDGPQLTSDGGLVWLSEADTALGLCAALAAHIPEWRHRAVSHSIETLVRQRVFQIACGYEDQNDAETLRSDPLLKLVCGRVLAARHHPPLAGRPARPPPAARDAPVTAHQDRRLGPAAHGDDLA